MECFVPQRVRMPPGSERASGRAVRWESSMQEPRWPTLAPFFKREKKYPACVLWLGLRAACTCTTHALTGASTPRSQLLLLKTWKISRICGCRLETSALLSGGPRHCRWTGGKNHTQEPRAFTCVSLSACVSGVWLKQWRSTMAIYSIYLVKPLGFFQCP